MSSQFVRLAAAIAASTFALGFSALCNAQETPGAATTTARPMSASLAPVTQAMLDGAGKDSKNWLHPNGSYADAVLHRNRSRQKGAS